MCHAHWRPYFKGCSLVMAVDRGRYGNSLSDSGKDLANLLVAALMVDQAAAKDPSPSASEAETQAVRHLNGQMCSGRAPCRRRAKPRDRPRPEFNKDHQVLSQL